jgi:hypothetical protein
MRRPLVIAASYLVAAVVGFIACIAGLAWFTNSIMEDHYQ